MSVETRTDTSASAPVLNGQAGSLISVLDYFLVLVLNWTKTDLGGNKAVYQIGDLTSTQFYLWVDDSVGQYAHVRAYEVWSGETGTRPFPTVAQRATFVFRKSARSTSAAVTWLIRGTSKCFFLFAKGYTPDYTNTHTLLGFGDFFSRLSGDSYNCFVWAASATGAAPTLTDGYAPKSTSNSTVYIARDKSLAAGAKQVTLRSLSIADAVYIGGPIAYPDPVSGGLVGPMPLYLLEDSTNSVRGRMPGVWDHPHLTIATLPDPVAGIADYPNRTWKPLEMLYSSWDTFWLLENSDWDAALTAQTV